jgi:hypothetical protein
MTTKRKLKSQLKRTALCTQVTDPPIFAEITPQASQTAKAPPEGGAFTGNKQIWNGL